MTATTTIDATIETLARECAAEALARGAEPRELTPDEDAGMGDYDALEDALGREPTDRESAAFRAAYSAALAADGEADAPAATVYRDGSLYVVVVGGMPTDAVQIGVGFSPGLAFAALQSTPIQCEGPYRQRALEWAAGAGWIRTANLSEHEAQREAFETIYTRQVNAHQLTARLAADPELAAAVRGLTANVAAAWAELLRVDVRAALEACFEAARLVEPPTTRRAIESGLELLRDELAGAL